MVLETVPVSPVETKLPETFGSAKVLSAVGSTTVKVVSKLLAVEPSKIISTLVLSSRLPVMLSPALCTYRSSVVWPEPGSTTRSSFS